LRKAAQVRLRVESEEMRTDVPNWNVNGLNVNVLLGVLDSGIEIGIDGIETPRK
jgi:hypothetical protein